MYQKLEIKIPSYKITLSICHHYCIWPYNYSFYGTISFSISNYPSVKCSTFNTHKFVITHISTTFTCRHHRGTTFAPWSIIKPFDVGHATHWLSLSQIPSEPPLFSNFHKLSWSSLSKSLNVFFYSSFSPINIFHCTCRF